MMRVAAGETNDGPPPPPTNPSEGGTADAATSPGSESETARKQDGPTLPAGVDDDIDADDVRVVPGTGGPDDVGDVDVDPADLNMPGHA